MFIAFRLKPGRDDDLISWLSGMGEGDRSYHVREALRRKAVGQELFAPPLVKIEARKVTDPIPVEVDLEKNLEKWLE